MRHFLILSLSIATCFGLQLLALRASGGRTLKSESNFFSSVGRIQAGAKAHPHIMSLGSSITGRLPDAAQGFIGIANMGCDGASGIDTLRAIDQGIIPAARWLVIEVNTLGIEVNHQPSDIARAMRNPWFQLGIDYPLLSSYARPSAFFYSKLLARKIGTFDPCEAERGFGTHTMPTLLGPCSGMLLDPAESKELEELSAIIERLQNKGSKFIFVTYPSAGKHKAHDWVVALVARTHSYWWDLERYIPPEDVRYTDAVHMDAVSATRATGDLLRAVQQLETN